MTAAEQVLRYSAFTDTPAGGNPAGVVLDARDMADARMLELAAEIGYSETAFLTPRAGGREYDVRYFSAEVEPHLGGPVRWVGSVGGEAKAELLRTARAVLFPLRWDEPGGTAVVEALSAGVPVVAMRRGVLPELVDHGVTGWLAETEAEFVGYLDRVDELDRDACREVAVRRFSPAAMAARYETLYRRVLAVAEPRHIRAPRVQAPLRTVIG